MNNWLTFKITDIFPVHNVGIVTARDHLTIKNSRIEMYETVKRFATLDEPSARSEFQLEEDSRDWNVKSAQEDILESGIDPFKVVPILYRPFDTRYTYFTGKSRGFICMPRPGLMRHMLKENLGLITVRQVCDKEFSHCFVTDTIVESRMAIKSRGLVYVFPLYLYMKKRIPENLDKNFRKTLIDGFKGKIIPTGKQIFNYIYAMLFSTLYRKGYAFHLSLDFPIIPFLLNKDFFMEMGKLGNTLIKIHLLKISELKGEPADKRKIDRNEKFLNLPKNIWEYQICGYPVIQKILKNIKDKPITEEESKKISRIARAIELTIEYQERIDRLLGKYCRV